MLNLHQVEYLLVGGYAVAYHGFPRATADIDIWLARHPANAGKTLLALREFGFGAPELNAELLLQENRVIRMGVPPLRIELLTGVSGVEFQECFAHKLTDEIDGVTVNIIDLQKLKENKRASGRYKDLEDLTNLP